MDGAPKDWCVDFAYCLPVLVAAPRQHPYICLRILRCDEHLDLMDRSLTRGVWSVLQCLYCPGCQAFSNGAVFG
uniref:Uncharacterized protein n=1 Tax=Rhodothermus marinus TaxID=29549 RepID=A0A7V2B0N8_RHOMR